jgi:hypothetical protein
MPNSKEHREKAQRNRDVLDAVKGTATPDWIAVIAFYTALHLVERLAAKDMVHHDKHQDRLHYLARHQQHRTIHTAFSSLHDAAHIARYGTVNQFDKAYPGDVVEKQLVGKCLKDITFYVDAFFAPVSPALPPPPPSP